MTTVERPSAEEVAEAGRRLRGAEPTQILRWGLARFPGLISIASSFSIEDCVVIDMAHRLTRDGATGSRAGEAGGVRVFALDTGRLPDETYMTAERMRAKYALEIEWFFPERAAVERLERTKGLYSFRDSLDDRHECCGLRKVAPLARALGALSAWVTGLRREQSVTRTDAAEVELDAGHGGLAKLNPIIDWTAEQTRAYANEHRVPIHPLHDRGYPSIGCAPCTRAVSPGEHPRAGRWWWENPENKECGLHPAR
jgi:phosphoadenosine phosphosulfate reductase